MSINFEKNLKKSITLINKNFKKPIVLTIFLFFTGNLLMFIGLSKGDVIASSLSRPIGANSWSTSRQMILGCTYAPAISGMLLIILSLIFSTILFINLVKKIN